MASMKLHVGDTVMVRVGKHKGKTGKVIAVNAEKQTVTVDGVNTVKRHLKPSQLNPQGGIEERTLPLAASKVGIVHPDDKNKTSRIGYKINKDGKKVRVYRQANDKEIK